VADLVQQRQTCKPQAVQHGFTLVELVMVIVIMGVIGGIVAVFMKSPIDAYIASGRRAALTDVADTLVRRMARDIRSALPNSIRISGSNCIEFIPTKTGGRYRAEEKTSGDDTSLDFSKADSTFNMLGSNSALPLSQQIGINDLIVVYNLGIAGADAFSTTNKNTARVSATPAEAGTPAETTIAIDATQFPLASGSNRFHVVAAAEQQVAYVCSGGNLYRSVASAPTASAACVAGGPKIASHVNCSQTSFSYTGSDLIRNALVSMVLSLQDSSDTETVTLQHEVHVSNTP
jgi:MSHA biogenesis protein MshO